MTVHTFSRYKNYKKADSAWLDEIPSHWIGGRIKDFVNPDTSTKLPENFSAEDLIEFVPMTNVNEELGEITKFNLVPLREVSSGYTKFRNKDVIFAKITPCMENGNCAIVGGLRYNIGFGSTEFMVFRASRKLTGEYLHYFLHNELFRRNAQYFMKGTAGQKRIGSHYMATHFFALPPLPEQQAIADYLDAKTAQIDRKIDLLEQKAEKYADLKQSLINETVTRGLDKTVPMKDSGVEWIGQVPAHWEVKRLKDIGFLFSGLAGKSGEDFTDESEYSAPFIPYTNILNNFYLSQSALKYVVIFPNERQNAVKKFDMFFLMSSEDYESLGKCSLLIQDIPIPTYLNSFCKGFRFTRKDVSPLFINYLLHSSVYKSNLSNEGRGFTRINLKMEKVNDIKLILPSLSEQKAIAEYLDTKTAQIDHIIEIIYIEIEKLKELRKTLINDVVTGKIKVTKET